MAFTDWTDFTSEFMSTFCPENEATSTLMRLESDHYFQGQQNVEAYIDEFKDLVDMSGYTDPITIVLKFHRGLNVTTQDKIAESGTDQPRDNDHQGWYVAARRLTSIGWPTRHSIMPHDVLQRSQQHPDTPTLLPRALCSCSPARPPRQPCPLHPRMPIQGHTPRLHPQSTPGTLMAPGHKDLPHQPATDVARLATPAGTATSIMTFAT
jgi:hypothetical protein